MYVISEDDEQARVIVEKIQSGGSLVMLEDWEMKILVNGERIKYYEDRPEEILESIKSDFVYDSRVSGSL